MREGTDSSGREQRLLDGGVLFRRARGVGGFAVAHFLGNGCGARFHRRVVHARGFAARFERGGVGVEFGFDAVAAAIERFFQDAQLFQFLQGVGEPVFDFRIEAVFLVEVHRHVQERAGRREPEAVAEAGADGFEGVEQAVEVGFPDVAAIDNAEGDDFGRRQQVNQLVDFAGGVDSVEVDAIDRQVVQEIEVVAEVAEVGGEQDFRRGAVQLVVGGFDRLAPVFVQGGNQAGFVNLYPFGTGLRQFVQQLFVNRQQALQQGEAVAVVLALAEPEVGDRADDDRLDAFHAERLRFLDLLQEALRVEFEAGVRVKFGDDVVIVAVEPFGHLAGGNASALVQRAAAARGTEEGIQLVAAAFVGALRQVAEGNAHVEHMVVQGEIAHRHKVKTGLVLPVAGAQRFGDVLQFGGGGLALPVGFLREFQFTFRADTRKAEVMDDSHGYS